MVNAIARNLADSNLAPDIMSRDAVRTSVATDRVCRDPAPALSAFEQRLNSSNTHQVVRCYWSDGFGLARMALPVTHTRGVFLGQSNARIQRVCGSRRCMRAKSERRPH